MATLMEPEAIGALAEEIARARRAVAFTGAGISTESGIPDFRGPQGLWTTMDPSEFTLDNYLNDPEHRARVWTMRVERASVTYEPNDAHRALVELEELGILDCVITQNVDGLHQDAGSSVVFELHGNPRSVRCLTCGVTTPADQALKRVAEGERDPRCELCGGVLKSGTISFGEPLPQAILDAACARTEACDLCVVIGSSLSVFPAASLPLQAVRSGARLVIVNEEPTPLDDLAHVVVRGGAALVMTEVVRQVRSALGR